jgi:hypothetical protein
MRPTLLRSLYELSNSGSFWLSTFQSGCSSSSQSSRIQTPSLQEIGCRATTLDLSAKLRA